jgi:hypothetical protein
MNLVETLLLFTLLINTSTVCYGNDRYGFDSVMDSRFCPQILKAKSFLNNFLVGRTWLCVGPLCLQSGTRSYFVGVGCGVGLGVGVGYSITGSGMEGTMFGKIIICGSF